MSEVVFDQLISWFQTSALKPAHLSENEKQSLKRKLSEYDFDEEMLEMADESDFRAVFPSDWTGKRLKFLLKAFHHTQSE